MIPGKLSAFVFLLFFSLLLYGCGKEIDGAVKEAWEDASLAARIKTKLAARGGLDLLRVEILVEKSIAELSGEVKTEKEKNLAEELALSVEGVKSVRNRITVNADAVTLDDVKKDLAVQGRIQTLFFKEEGLRGLGISVMVKRGTVTLKGMVRYPEQKIMAEKIARSVPGIKEVENRIEIEPASTSAPGRKTEPLPLHS
jgi:osmotically-inducible protein OsmY